MLTTYEQLKTNVGVEGRFAAFSLWGKGGGVRFSVCNATFDRKRLYWVWSRYLFISTICGEEVFNGGYRICSYSDQVRAI